METKAWYKSKAVWGVVVMFVAGGLIAIGYPEVGNGLLAIGAAFGILGVRTATTTIGS